eukprot:jgi/Tetstr1/457316/TSEL_043920.t1
MALEMTAARPPPPPVLAESPGNTPTVDLTETLSAMQYRKVFRYHRGAYTRSRPMALLLWFLAMAVLTVFDTMAVGQRDDGITVVSFVTEIGPGSSGALQIWAVIGLAIAAFLQMRLKQQYSLRWLHTMAATTVILQACTPSPAILFSWEMVNHPSAIPSQGDAGTGSSGNPNAYFKNNGAGVLTVLYIIVSFTYIICVAVARVLFPYLARTKHFVPAIRQVLEPDPLAVAELERLRQAEIDEETVDGRLAHVRCRYSGKFIWNTARILCEYSGHIDEEGRPDGFGVWDDQHPQGESLEGYWKNGLPVGPFRSRETGSGSGFVRIRVGFVTCREESITDIKCMPSYAPFTMGVASAECCVSGAFFHEHPLLTPVYQDMEIASGDGLDAECEQMLKEMYTLGGISQEPSSVNVFADAVSGISVTGFQRLPRTLESTITISVNRLDASSQAPPLAEQPRFTSEAVADSPKAPDTDIEAADVAMPLESYASAPLSNTYSAERSAPPLVGPSMSIRRGLARQITHKKFLRQQYDPHLQIQGWQALSGVKGCEVLIHFHGYNSACEHGIKNIAQLWTFASFPSHIKPVVFSWPTGKLAAYPWAQTKGAENDNVARSLREFIESLAAAGVRDFHFQTHSMGARMLMHALPFIQSLFHDSTPDKKTTFRSQFSGPTDANPSDVNLNIEPSDFDGQLRLVNVILMNPEYGLHQFVKTRAEILDRICDITTVYGDLKDAALLFSYVMNNLQMKWFKKSHGTSWLPTEVTASQPCRGLWKQRDTCLGLHIYDVKDDGRPVRVDMIDCTFLESNVQGGRHNTFTLNRSVIEDIYDVVVNRRPAMQRSHRLEPRGGNVYSFLVAPSHIVAP